MDASRTKGVRRNKKIVARETLLVYPNFNQPFDIHTDASDKQLGAVISQNGLPIAFYSRKLNSAQRNYTTTERELLAIVETLKEFRNILLGQQIRVYTDHKNLTYKNFNTERVIRWRMVIEDFAPELIYIQGTRNVVADAISRLELDTPTTNTVDVPQNKELFTIAHSLTQSYRYNSTIGTINEIPTTAYLAECYGLDDLPDDSYLLNYKLLQKEQQKDEHLLQRAMKESTSAYTVEIFHGGGKTRKLICWNGKIVVPQSLQRHMVEWYHSTLCHPGATRTEMTIKQHFHWKGLSPMVNDICKKCHTCQTTKRIDKKYGHVPEKKTTYIPWDTLCVDLIGPYTIHRKAKSGKKRKDLTLWCVTMIDPATG